MPSWKKNSAHKNKKIVLFSVKKYIVIAKNTFYLVCNFSQLNFFMLSTKKSCQGEKHLLINMQIYAWNSCAVQKHRGRWRLISRQMFDSTRLSSPFYVN